MYTHQGNKCHVCAMSSFPSSKVPPLRLKPVAQVTVALPVTEISPCSMAMEHSSCRQPLCAPQDSEPRAHMCPNLWLSHPAKLCRELQPSGKDGSSQQREGPAFPCEHHTPQKTRTEEAFAGPSSWQREHECSDFFFGIRMERCQASTSSCWASPAFKLLHHHEMHQVQAWFKEPSGDVLVCSWAGSRGTCRGHSHLLPLQLGLWHGKAGSGGNHSLGKIKSQETLWITGMVRAWLQLISAGNARQLLTFTLHFQRRGIRSPLKRVFVE